MGCPTPERLVELVQGTISEQERSELEVHIDACQGCRIGVAAIVKTEQPPKTLGRFRIDGVLGAGGMGVVYRAFDPVLARAVAVKVVRPDVDDRDMRPRLEREAKALGRLSHPNVCHVYDVGNDGDEVWIAMELVDGATLRAYLATGPTRDQILAILDGAGRGLAAAHDAGLVHRDVKPENVLVDRSGRAVVTDFGLARALDGDRATKTSVLAGTPAYMAPEQMEGRPADARTDQYAFAVMAHEALVGLRPKHGVASDRLPGPLRTVLARALADDPAARWPSLPALLEALAGVRGKPRRRWPALAVVAGLAAFAGGGVTLYATRRDDPAPAPPPPAPTITQITPDAAPPDASAIVAAVPPDAAPAPTRPKTKPPGPKPAPPPPRVAAIAPAAPPAPAMQPPSGPRFGQLNPHNAHAQDLDRIEQYLADDCEFPSSLPKPSLPGPPPIDWGKVKRGPIDVIATLDSGAERDMHLYEVTGARGTYVFDARGAALAGELDAKPGDFVVLCPERAQDRWQLPGEWASTQLTTVRFVGKYAGPPDLAHLPYVHPRAIPYTTKQQLWPYGDRFITYVHDPRLTSDGKYYVDNWYFELDAGKPGLPSHYNGLMIADHVRYEQREGHTVAIVHAVEFRDHIFPR